MFDDSNVSKIMDFFIMNPDKSYTINDISDGTGIKLPKLRDNMRRLKKLGFFNDRVEGTTKVRYTLRKGEIKAISKYIEFHKEMCKRINFVSKKKYNG